MLEINVRLPNLTVRHCAVSTVETPLSQSWDYSSKWKIEQDETTEAELNYIERATVIISMKRMR